MTKVKYGWAIIAAIGLAATLYWWNHKPAPATAEIATDEKQMAHYYAQMTGRLFNLQLNGTLRLFYRLNNNPELSAAGFICILLHTTETAPEGTARSRWKLPFTESYLVPHGPDDLQWCQPSGNILLFKNARTAQTSIIPGRNGWKLKKLGPVAYNISNNEGDGFFYDNGCLAEITTRGGRHYRLTTRGGLITKVAEIDQQNLERTLFAAEFDDFGHCTLVQFAGHPAEEFEWDAQGLLQDWKVHSRLQINFQYNEGLLARVVAPGKKDFPIAWSENKEFRNHDIAFGAPVYVKSAGTRNYSISYSVHGILIATKCPDEKQNSTTLYNPWAHTLVQKSGSKTLHFDFESSEGETTLRTKRVEVTESAK